MRSDARVRNHAYVVVRALLCMTVRVCVCVYVYVLSCVLTRKGVTPCVLVQTLLTSLNAYKFSRLTSHVPFEFL